LTEPTREMKRNYWVLIASMVSLQVTSSTIYMVMPVFFSNYGISMSDNGYLIAVGTFAGVVSAFLAGKYSDTHGRKPILLGGAVVYAIVFSSPPSARTTRPSSSYASSRASPTT